MKIEGVNIHQALLEVPGRDGTTSEVVLMEAGTEEDLRQTIREFNGAREAAGMPLAYRMPYQVIAL